MFKVIFLSLLSLIAASPVAKPQSLPQDETAAPALHRLSKRHPLPPLPDNDQWYAAPDNLNASAPGDILKWRNGPRPLSLDNTHPLPTQAIYQIQYRTTNAKGLPMANVMTVIIPYFAKTSNLFTYIYFSDTPSPNFNPSIEMTLTSNPVIFTKEQMGPLVAALDEGWIVCVPDDNGPEASFPTGPTAAYTTLDAMRAMLKSQSITGLAPDATITLNGYSGGGITAAWLSELQPTYAPELKIAGVALGGLIPDFVRLSQSIRAQTGYYMWGFITFIGLSHDYPELSTWLDGALIPSKAADFWTPETLSIQGITDKFYSTWPCDYFTNGCAAWDEPIPSEILYNATTMGLTGNIPITPWYLYETAADEMSPVNITDALYSKYCAGGANIEYEASQLGLAHADESLVMFPGAFQWMKDRHNGVPITTGCSKSAISPATQASGWPLSILVPIGETLMLYFNGALQP